MIQSDNITEGIEMLGQPNGQPLTEPQIQELNGHVEKLPVVVELKENNRQLLEGQQDIEKRLDKGAERMDGIEDELKSLKDALTSGLKDVISEVRDQKLYELKSELKDRKSNDNGLKNDIIKIGIVAVLSIVGWLFIKAYG